MSETRPHSGSARSTVTGSVLGSYRILGEISTGGMGTVYRAEHVLLGRPAAVKLLRPDLTTNDALVQRFVNEAKAVTACKHPGIVEVYDFDYSPDGRAFFVMELLEGEPLARRLARTRLSEPEAAALAHGIASALKAAHRVGVVHRDLKPDNVFLVPDPDGGLDRTKVLDFGIAKLADRSSASRDTQTGTLIGTPLYMAPEQARAAGAIDHRADLYSLGCIIYHMLVGRPPFVAEGGGEIIAMQLFGQVEPPSGLVPVTPEMEHIVLRLLEKDPADRFQNAGELVLALAALDPRLARSWPGTTRPSDAAARAPIEPAPRPTAPTSEPPPVRATQRIRSATPIIAGAIAMIVAAGVGVAVMLQGSGAPANLVPASAPSAPAAATAAPPAPPTPPATPAAPAVPAPIEPRTVEPRTVEPRTVEPAAPPSAASESTASAPPARGKRPGRKTTDKSAAAAASNTDTPDKAIEVIHELRQVDPPKPGEHTQDGSPMESEVGFERKRSKPRDETAP
jgi:eukaryotic-like serine/threonine-protein kinase